MPGTPGAGSGKAPAPPRHFALGQLQLCLHGRGVIKLGPGGNEANTYIHAFKVPRVPLLVRGQEETRLLRYC